jgi:hypothetical protein
VTLDSGHDDAGSGRGRRDRAREALTAFIELFALTGLLVAQPVLNFLGNGSRYMVETYRLTTLDFIVFALVVLFVPPIIVWGLETISGAVWPGARGRIHAVICGLLLGAVVANFVKVATPLPAGVYLVLAAGAAVIATRLVRRVLVVRQWLRVLAVAPLIFATLFVTASPASVLLGDGAAHPASVTIRRPARVVMIVLDEFPEVSLLDGNGRVDAGLFPNFAALADASTWYRNDTTVAEYTIRAVPAILTGKLAPLVAPAPTASKYPHSLFTLLGKTYRLNVHETAEQVCPDNLCGTIGTGKALSELTHDGLLVMRNLMDPDRDSWEHHVGFRLGIERGEEFHAFAAAQAFIDSLRPSGAPTLDYLHLLWPHQPWRYLTGGHDAGAPAVPIDYLLGKPPTSPRAALGREMYLLQLQATDWWLGRTIAKLKAIGAWDQSLVVLTADHGVSFPFQRHAARSNFQQILWTPLFVKAPGQEAGAITDRPALSVDVLPTMADILGVKIPWKIDGRSLRGAQRTDGQRPFMHRDAGLGVPAQFPGPLGFARVRRARAAPLGGDPRLRIYRIGPYGRLVGQEVEPLQRNSSASPVGTLSSPGDFDNVDPAARVNKWTRVDGTINGPGVAVRRTVAIAVNGRVAGLAFVDELSQYHALLAPTLFASGHNDVAAYLVTGRPSAPHLIAVQLTAGPSTNKAPGA